MVKGPPKLPYPMQKVERIFLGANIPPFRGRARIGRGGRVIFDRFSIPYTEKKRPKEPLSALENLEISYTDNQKPHVHANDNTSVDVEKPGSGLGSSKEEIECTSTEDRMQISHDDGNDASNLRPNFEDLYKKSSGNTKGAAANYYLSGSNGPNAGTSVSEILEDKIIRKDEPVIRNGRVNGTGCLHSLGSGEGEAATAGVQNSNDLAERLRRLLHRFREEDAKEERGKREKREQPATPQCITVTAAEQPGDTRGLFQKKDFNKESTVAAADVASEQANNKDTDMNSSPDSNNIIWATSLKCSSTS